MCQTIILSCISFWPKGECLGNGSFGAARTAQPGCRLGDSLVRLFWCTERRCGLLHTAPAALHGAVLHSLGPVGLALVRAAAHAAVARQHLLQVGVLLLRAGSQPSISTSSPSTPAGAATGTPAAACGAAAAAACRPPAAAAGAAASSTTIRWQSSQEVSRTYISLRGQGRSSAWCGAVLTHGSSGACLLVNQFACCNCAAVAAPSCIHWACSCVQPILATCGASSAGLQTRCAIA